MKKTNSPIRVVATRVTGGLHAAKNIPCQDFYQYACSGNKFVAVVSDGAGSAKYGRIGAKVICETIVNLLINTPLKDAETAVRKAIISAREKLIIHRLNRSKSEREILNFSATVVGAIYHKNKGLFFHIGDGAGVALLGDENNRSCLVSRPANGSFSCETYFYTMENWRDCLRFTTIEKAESLFLMTDGVTAFALSEDMRRIKDGFLDPINRYLHSETNKTRAQKALNNTLNAAKVHKLNSDDKTFLWAGL